MESPDISSTSGCSFFYMSLCIYLGAPSGASGLQHAWPAGSQLLPTPVSSSEQATRLSPDIVRQSRACLPPCEAGRQDGSTLAEASSVRPRTVQAPAPFLPCTKAAVATVTPEGGGLSGGSRRS